jgi:hypothetical protein
MTGNCINGLWQESDHAHHFPIRSVWIKCSTVSASRHTLGNNRICARLRIRFRLHSWNTHPEVIVRTMGRLPRV